MKPRQLILPFPFSEKTRLKSLLVLLAAQNCQRLPKMVILPRLYYIPTFKGILCNPSGRPEQMTQVNTQAGPPSGPTGWATSPGHPSRPPEQTTQAGQSSGPLKGATQAGHSSRPLKRATRAGHPKSTEWATKRVNQAGHLNERPQAGHKIKQNEKNLNLTKWKGKPSWWHQSGKTSGHPKCASH